jgi:hypothetical protein
MAGLGNADPVINNLKVDGLFGPAADDESTLMTRASKPARRSSGPRWPPVLA